MQIAAPTHVIQHAVLDTIAGVIGHRIQQQTVDREVAPQHILTRIERELHRIWPPPVAVRAIMPKRRDLGGHALFRQVIDH
jgi:hypothetical protein